MGNHCFKPFLVVRGIEHHSKAPGLETLRAQAEKLNGRRESSKGVRDFQIGQANTFAREQPVSENAGSSAVGISPDTSDWTHPELSESPGTSLQHLPAAEDSFDTYICRTTDLPNEGQHISLLGSISTSNSSIKADSSGGKGGNHSTVSPSYTALNPEEVPPQKSQPVELVPRQAMQPVEPVPPQKTQPVQPSFGSVALTRATPSSIPHGLTPSGTPGDHVSRQYAERAPTYMLQTVSSSRKQRQLKG